MGAGRGGAGHPGGRPGGGDRRGGGDRGAERGRRRVRRAEGPVGVGGPQPGADQPRDGRRQRDARAAGQRGHGDGEHERPPERAPHALHIHAGGQGQCPPASAARLHNNHLAISTTDGIRFYGPPVTALTTSGDTTPASILAFGRFPAVGNIRYVRTITVPAPVAAYIRANNAVIVAHGIDYDGSGLYDGVLDRSDLNKSLPGTATAPALCGPVRASQTVAAAGGARVYTASLSLLDGAPVAAAPAVRLAASYARLCHLAIIGAAAAPGRTA